MSYVDFSEYGDHSQGYECLYNPAVELLASSDIDRMVVEVGVREGGSLMTLMSAIIDTNPKRYIISIDPYGYKPYLSRKEVIQGMYTDDHYLKMLENVTPYVVQNKLHWVHYKHTSTDWIEFWPKLDFWGGKKLDDKFAFVHLDGDHTNSIVSQELEYFVPRTKGWVVIDDADQLELDKADIAKFNGTVYDNYLWIRGTDED